MKVVLECIVIYTMYKTGEILGNTIPFLSMIPSNIIGMILFLILLCTKIIKIEFVEKTGNFLLKNMSFFFIPLTVSIMDKYELIKNDFIKIFLILLISNACVMFVTSKVTDSIILKRQKKENK